MINHKFTFDESKKRAVKAVQMSGRSLDLTNPSKDFKWSRYSDKMLELWDQQDTDYQLMVTLEQDLIMFCSEELVDYVNFYALGGDR